MPNDADDTQDAGFADLLEAVFAAVVDKARKDPAFARQLATAVVSSKRFTAAAKETVNWEAEAPDLDLDALMTSDGAAGVRTALRDLTRRQIYALVKVKDLNGARTSSFNKTQLIEHVVRSLEREAEPYKSVFDY